jgi:hypothetical protein
MTVAVARNAAVISRRSTGTCVWALLLCAALGACGSEDRLTSPSASPLRGQWIGTTAQGTPITFTVSADEKVTAITLGYAFNGCSGSHTFDNLNLDTAPTVICIPGPCSPAVSSYRAFNYSTRSSDGPSTTVNGLFPSANTAEGAVAFRDYPGCGTALSVAWTAARR